MGAAAGGIAWASLSDQADAAPAPAREKEGATVRCVFLYPPSKSFADDPDGWWSWPGNEFDAEGRKKQYMAAFREMEKRLGAPGCVGCGRCISKCPVNIDIIEVIEGAKEVAGQ